MQVDERDSEGFWMLGLLRLPRLLLLFLAAAAPPPRDVCRDIGVTYDACMVLVHDVECWTMLSGVLELINMVLCEHFVPEMGMC
jgi:hypothetical protein